MQRFTIQTSGGQAAVETAFLQGGAAGYTGPAAQRLFALEQLCEALCAQQQDIARQLDALRGAGKKNSVKFKELLGQKLANAHTLTLLQVYGIWEDTGA